MINVWMLRVRIRSSYFYLNFIHFQDFEFLILYKQEFPKEHFARAISLVVAINQFSFAFGPSLLGQLQQASGSYAAALCLCLAMQLGAAAVIVSQRRPAA